MIVDNRQIFNLWDTNGRRSDVINAISIYLGILKEMKEKYPKESWESYPNSLSQYRFYKRAIEASPDVFSKHMKFDEIQTVLNEDYDGFINKERKWIDGVFPRIKDNFDVNLEARARHYTSNLVRLGFATEDRNITPAGYDFLSARLERDEIEDILPLSDLNISLIRQLMKLRIYTKPCKTNDKRKYYSPFYMAMYILLYEEKIDKALFSYIVQGASPYWYKNDNVEDIINIFKENRSFQQFSEEIPSEFRNNTKIDYNSFAQHIRNRKSGEVVALYYDFYSILYDYVNCPNNETYQKLKSVFVNEDNRQKLNKAFGYGYNVFDFGNYNSQYSFQGFVKNNNSILLNKDKFNQNFYSTYDGSKYVDIAAEYSDTTIRLLSASGIFSFSKALPEISFRDVWLTLFPKEELREMIFGTCSEQEIIEAEELFIESLSFMSIIRKDKTVIGKNLSILSKNIGTSTIELKDRLATQKRVDFEKHIATKYKKETIISLLTMFSDRKNDKKIKKIVNEDSTVPTIFEYILAIAWYYISDKKVSVYDSLNLTLNGDFEPIIHAAGGAGDIVVQYESKIVMIEATLMNKNAQKRGEWEPVLRHAINLTSEEVKKEVTTLFVADELDFNTINIWRAVAAVPLESSSTGKLTEHVVIMPFRINDFVLFLQKDIRDITIIDKIKDSFDLIKTNKMDNWRNEILDNIL